MSDSLQDNYPHHPANLEASRQQKADHRRTDGPNNVTDFLDNDYWIATHSGNWFDIRDPDPSAITLKDITWALAKEQRFGNQLSRHYSVADHSVILSRLAPDELALEALTHDAAEAYTGDIIGPVKRRLEGFKLIETTVDKAISRALGIHCGLKSEKVAYLDRMLLAAEVQQFFGLSGTWPVLHEAELFQTAKKNLSWHLENHLGAFASRVTFGFRLAELMTDQSTRS